MDKSNERRERETTRRMDGFKGRAEQSGLQAGTRGSVNEQGTRKNILYTQLIILPCSAAHARTVDRMHVLLLCYKIASMHCIPASERACMQSNELHSTSDSTLHLDANNDLDFPSWRTWRKQPTAGAFAAATAPQRNSIKSQKMSSLLVVVVGCTLYMYCTYV